MGFGKTQHLVFPQRLGLFTQAIPMHRKDGCFSPSHPIPVNPKVCVAKIVNISIVFPGTHSHTTSNTSSSVSHNPHGQKSHDLHVRSHDHQVSPDSSMRSHDQIYSPPNRDRKHLPLPEAPPANQHPANYGNYDKLFTFQGIE